VVVSGTADDIVGRTVAVVEEDEVAVVCVVAGADVGFAVVVELFSTTTGVVSDVVDCVDTDTVKGAVNTTSRPAEIVTTASLDAGSPE
jgi:hypothetical protein